MNLRSLLTVGLSCLSGLALVLTTVLFCRPPKPTFSSEKARQYLSRKEAGSGPEEPNSINVGEEEGLLDASRQQHQQEQAGEQQGRSGQGHAQGQPLPSVSSPDAAQGPKDPAHPDGAAAAQLAVHARGKRPSSGEDAGPAAGAPTAMQPTTSASLQHPPRPSKRPKDTAATAAATHAEAIQTRSQVVESKPMDVAHSNLQDSDHLQHLLDAELGQPKFSVGKPTAQAQPVPAATPSLESLLDKEFGPPKFALPKQSVAGPTPSPATVVPAAVGSSTDAGTGLLDVMPADNASDSNNKQTIPAAKHHLRLEVLTGPNTGSVFDTMDDSLEVCIGRVPDCSLALAEDPEVSSRHAVIRFSNSDKCWKLTDVGSLNGSSLNGTTLSTNRQPSKPHPLANGDMLEFGSTTRVQVTCTPSHKRVAPKTSANSLHAAPHRVAADGERATGPFLSAPMMFNMQPNIGSTLGSVGVGPHMLTALGAPLVVLDHAGLGMSLAVHQRLGADHKRLSTGCEDVPFWELPWQPELTTGSSDSNPAARNDSKPAGSDDKVASSKQHAMARKAPAGTSSNSRSTDRPQDAMEVEASPAPSNSNAPTPQGDAAPAAASADTADAGPLLGSSNDSDDSGPYSSNCGTLRLDGAVLALFDGHQGVKAALRAKEVVPAVLRECLLGGTPPVALSHPNQAANGAANGSAPQQPENENDPGNGQPGNGQPENGLQQAGVQRQDAQGRQEAGEQDQISGTQQPAGEQDPNNSIQQQAGEHGLGNGMQLQGSGLILGRPQTDQATLLQRVFLESDSRIALDEGCTATLVLLQRDPAGGCLIQSANVGDSSAVLVQLPPTSTQSAAAAGSRQHQQDAKVKTKLPPKPSHLPNPLHLQSSSASTRESPSGSPAGPLPSPAGLSPREPNGWLAQMNTSMTRSGTKLRSNMAALASKVTMQHSSEGQTAETAAWEPAGVASAQTPPAEQQGEGEQAAHVQSDSTQIPPSHSPSSHMPSSHMPSSQLPLDKAALAHADPTETGAAHVTSTSAAAAMTPSEGPQQGDGHDHDGADAHSWPHTSLSTLQEDSDSGSPFAQPQPPAGPQLQQSVIDQLPSIHSVVPTRLPPQHTHSRLHNSSSHTTPHDLPAAAGNGNSIGNGDGSGHGVPAGMEGGVLEGGGHWWKMSEDHRISSSSKERARLAQLGHKSVRTRLYGLNISRMLGDKFLKDESLGFIAEPHVSHVLRVPPTVDAPTQVWNGQQQQQQQQQEQLADAASTSSHQADKGSRDTAVKTEGVIRGRTFVLLASDGLWDVVPEARAAALLARTIAHDPGTSVVELAGLLLSQAVTLRSKDDITVMVLEIHNDHQAASHWS